MLSLESKVNKTLLNINIELHKSSGCLVLTNLQSAFFITCDNTTGNFQT